MSNLGNQLCKWFDHVPYRLLREITSGPLKGTYAYVEVCRRCHKELPSENTQPRP